MPAPIGASPVPALSLWRTWAVAGVLALVFGFIEAAQLRLGSSVVGRAMPWQFAVTAVFPYWVLFACLMPLVVVAARRLHLWRFVERPNVPAFAATATGFAFLALAGRVVVATFNPGSAGITLAAPGQIFKAYFVLDLLTYTALLGTVYAFHYYREVKARELLASQLQASLAEARLKVLESQVDPDFLFNTLDAVSALARHGQQEAVVETLGRLSELLREALSGERPQEIPLTRELNLVEDYLELQRIRLAGQFSIGYDIADDVFEALVPSLMLPVLVEHAVVHGAPHPTTARHIKILALKAEPTVLRLEVVDTVAWLGTPGERDQKDIRLQSTRERLQQLYGAAHAIDVGRTAEGGARVVITLPFRQD